MNPLNHATVSAIYPLSMIQFAVERGVSAQRILNNADVTLEQLHRPSARITPMQQAVISFNLVTELGDPGVGLELGLRSNITKTGLMGFGLMSCATFREVSDLGVRYLKTRVPYFTLSKLIEGDLAVVQPCWTYPFPQPTPSAHKWRLKNANVKWPCWVTPKASPTACWHC